MVLYLKKQYNHDMVHGNIWIITVFYTIFSFIQ